jgi:hypothetical protein
MSTLSANKNPSLYESMFLLPKRMYKTLLDTADPNLRSRIELRANQINYNTADKINVRHDIKNNGSGSGQPKSSIVLSRDKTKTPTKQDETSMADSELLAGLDRLGLGVGHIGTPQRPTGEADGMSGIASIQPTPQSLLAQNENASVLDGENEIPLTPRDSNVMPMTRDTSSISITPPSQIVKHRRRRRIVPLPQSSRRRIVPLPQPSDDDDDEEMSPVRNIMDEIRAFPVEMEQPQASTPQSGLASTMDLMLAAVPFLPEKLVFHP